jgi:predicted transglutaminase-like cysteine proteinase
MRFHSISGGFAVVLGVIFALGAVSPAAAVTIEQAFIAERGLSSVPLGHAQFCTERPQECAANAVVVAAEPLTSDRWNELVRINAGINAAVVPATDEALYQIEEYWTYPHGYGDCEDYALAKRRELIDIGWPASTLLMTVVREPNGDGHAVLTARTDRGDFILDNQEPLINLWSDTPYRFVKRQSQANAGQWVDLDDARTVSVAAR